MEWPVPPDVGSEHVGGTDPPPLAVDGELDGGGQPGVGVERPTVDVERTIGTGQDPIDRPDGVTLGDDHRGTPQELVGARPDVDGEGADRMRAGVEVVQLPTEPVVPVRDGNRSTAPAS